MNFGIMKAPTVRVFEWNRQTGAVRAIDVPDRTFHVELCMYDMAESTLCNIQDHRGNRYDIIKKTVDGVPTYHLRRQGP